MKARSTLIIASVALVFFLMLGTTTRAEAQCCLGNVIAAPFVAAGAIVAGAVTAAGAIVTAPFYALSCGCGTPTCFAVPACACGIPVCNPCGSSAS